MPESRRLPLSEAPTFPVPTHLYLRLSTSNVCNLRCKHCHIWMNRDPRNLLSTERRVELIREFGRLRPGGIVEFPGGEVTLAFDELCTLAEACNEAGLDASVVTNGSNLQTTAAAERLIQSGLRAITVSLDSHRPEVHDYVRGVPGAFEQATSALRLLLEARGRSGQPTTPEVQAIAVVFDGNVHELSEYVEFCRSLGVDRASLQILNRTFNNYHATRDVFFEQHFWHEPDAKRRASNAVRDVVERYTADPLLNLRSEDLPRLEGAIMGVQAAPPDLECASHWRNVIVNSDGEVSLCFNQPDGAATRSVGNVAQRSLTSILAGSAAAEMRRRMAVCRKPCAQLECHRLPTPPAGQGLAGERVTRLEIDEVHRDTFPVARYASGSKGRLVVMRGLGDNLRVLHLLRDTDHVICFTTGDYREREYEAMLRVCEVFGVDRQRLSVLCNYPAQVVVAKRAGLAAEFCNANAFIDESVFRPSPVQKTFDAVSNARLIEAKRVHLASKVSSLALILGHELPAESQAAARIPHVYLGDRPLSPHDVVRVLCASHVGLALSETDGPCLASSEYLLCGLPVVSTPSRGGRDIWYDRDNSLICEPTPEAVRDGVRTLVERLKRGEIEPQRIRARHLAQAAEHRRRFLELTSRIFAQIGAAEDPVRVFARAFENSGILPPYQSLSELQRGLG